MLNWFQPIRACTDITIQRLSTILASEADLSEANAFFGLRLPEEFQEFLRSENAVSFASSSHDVVLRALDPEDEDHVITFLYGLGEPSHFDIRYIQSHYFFDKWIGLPYILVGGSAALQICLHCPTGQVYGHYLKADAPATSNAGVKRLMPLATSFKKFCKRLEPEIRV